MSSALEFRIHGMDCAEEVAVLKRELIPAVRDPDRLRFDVLRGKMIVAAGTPHVTAGDVERLVRATGMRAERWTDVQPGAGERSLWQRRGRMITTIASGVFTTAGFVVHSLVAGAVAAFGSEGLPGAASVPGVAVALYGAGIVSGAWFVAPKAWHAVKRLRPDMNLLMTIAVVGAAAIGQWLEAAVVSFLFALSLALESWSVGRARRAVEALLAIAPPTARLLQQWVEPMERSGRLITPAFTDWMEAADIVTAIAARDRSWRSKLPGYATQMPIIALAGRGCIPCR